MAEALPTPEASRSPADLGQKFLGWCRRSPLQVLLSAGLLGTLVYFYVYFRAFGKVPTSTIDWAISAWNPENNQEHSFLIFPIFLYLLWHHRNDLAAAEKRPSNAGLASVLVGVLIFLLGVRALQPRLALFALPILLLGSAWFLWGRAVARVLLFPCVFLLFMVPVGGLVQGTVSLQLLVTSVCNVLASLVGVKIEASGTTINSLDGSFNFEIAEGCSGIRSLMAMMTLTALYVHFTQRALWKKVTVFAGSIVFAVVGNIGRIFTVILVARFISPKLAGGIYHDYSGFVFFPIAVLAMVSFGNLLNLDWKERVSRWTKPQMPGAPPDAGGDDARTKTPAAISYDY